MKPDIRSYRFSKSSFEGPKKFILEKWLQFWQSIIWSQLYTTVYNPCIYLKVGWNVKAYVTKLMLFQFTTKSVSQLNPYQPVIFRRTLGFEQ